ncbi:MAG: hypothetical protein WD003_01875 [Candidatus Paceibacterota bacterium]
MNLVITLFVISLVLAVALFFLIKIAQRQERDDEGGNFLPKIPWSKIPLGKAVTVVVVLGVSWFLFGWFGEYTTKQQHLSAERERILALSEEDWEDGIYKRYGRQYDPITLPDDKWTEITIPNGHNYHMTAQNGCLWVKPYEFRDNDRGMRNYLCSKVETSGWKSTDRPPVLMSGRFVAKSSFATNADIPVLLLVEVVETKRLDRRRYL